MIGLFLLTVIISLLFYITAVIMYLSNRNIFKNKDDFRKFLTGPFIIFLVYGLLRSKILGVDQDEENTLLYSGLVLSMLFIIYYGFTKWFTNSILSVNGVLLRHQFSQDEYI